MLDGLTTKDLLAIARREDPSIDERTLEYWRGRRLLPTPERVGQQGRNPVRVYPDGTDDWLRALLAWRATSLRDLDAVRVALWAEGYPQEFDDVRASGAAVMDRSLRRIARNLEPYGGYHPEDPARTAAAIEGFAFKQAGRRGPRNRRPIRMRMAERAAAKAYGMRSLLGLEAGGVPDGELARLVGRDFGLPDRGVPAETRNLIGLLPLGLAEMARVGSIPAIRLAYEHGDGRLFRAARPLVLAAVFGFNAVRGSMQGALGLPTTFMDDTDPPDAEGVVVMLGMNVGMLAGFPDDLPSDEDVGELMDEVRNLDPDELRQTIDDEATAMLRQLPRAAKRPNSRGRNEGKT
jgi:hypothetical protein